MKKVSEVDMRFNYFVKEVYPLFDSVKDDVIHLDSFLKREVSLQDDILFGDIEKKYKDDSFGVYDSLKLLRTMGIPKNKNVVNIITNYYKMILELDEYSQKELRGLLLMFIDEGIDFNINISLRKKLGLNIFEEIKFIKHIYDIYLDVKDEGKKSASTILNILNENIQLNKIDNDLLKKLRIVDKKVMKEYVSFYSSILDNYDKKYLSSDVLLFYIRKCHRFNN